MGTYSLKFRLLTPCVRKWRVGEERGAPAGYAGIRRLCSDESGRGKANPGYRTRVLCSLSTQYNLCDSIVVTRYYVAL
jgi:hypothetical protein